MKVQDIFGASPQTVLNKPFMHVQEQQATGTDGGGASAVTWEDRTLNTVVVNEISGASLASDLITLPAGTYYIETESAVYGTQMTAQYVRDSANNILIAGPNLYPSQMGHEAPANGRITLAASTQIKVTTYTAGARADNGLGYALDNGETEIFTDIKIWQLDAVARTPVLVNDSLYPLPSNTLVVGNMFGLEYAWTNVNQVTVQPGICMDSTNAELISLSSATAKNIGTTINEIYHLFVCKAKSGGAISVETDTDVDGSGLTATYYFRWIGFVRNNSSGDLVQFVMKDNHMAFGSASENVVSTGITTTFATVDHSAMIPATRVDQIEYGGRDVTSGSVIYASQDGTDAEFVVCQTFNTVDDTNYNTWGGVSYSNVGLKPFNASREFKGTTGTVDLLIQAVTMKR